MKHTSFILAVLVVGALSTGARAAQDEPVLDNSFLVKASNGIHATIDISKLADKHAASPKVKEFAASMVKRHQQCLDKLAQATKDRKIGTDLAQEKQIKTEIDHLSKLQGSEFDREYIQWIVHSHKKAISCMETQIKQGKNAAVTVFAQENLQEMKEHLKQAEQIAKVLGVS